MREMDEMVEIMHRLRTECPWDKEQSLKTLRSYLLEESYECLSAMNDFIAAPTPANRKELVEELGDVLLQILFQSEILGESASGKTVFAEVCNTLQEKLVRRHPHIFEGKNKSMSAEEVHRQWDQIKAEEKNSPEKKLKPAAAGAFQDLKLTGSALMDAEKIGKRSKKIKFDWRNAEEVWRHFKTEVDELENAKTFEEKSEELGDVFFTLAQWARHAGVDSEVSAASSNQKFLKRFQLMEEFAGKSSEDFKKLSLEEKEQLWVRAKEKLRMKSKSGNG